MSTMNVNSLANLFHSAPLAHLLTYAALCLDQGSAKPGPRALMIRPAAACQFADHWFRLMV